MMIVPFNYLLSFLQFSSRTGSDYPLFCFVFSEEMNKRNLVGEIYDQKRVKKCRLFVCNVLDGSF